MTVISKAEFAARRGWAKSYVSKLANQDRLVLAEDGKKIELEATEALLAKTADPSKAGVAERHERIRLEREAQIAVEEPAVPQIAEVADFQKSRALREHYLALQERDNFLKQQGVLVEREAVEMGAYNAGRLLRDQLLGMPPQLAPELAVMTDPWQIEKHLTAAIRRSLEDAERLSSADLEHALTTS
ncbi:terminase small subunit [Pseudomonas sp. RT6P73]